MKRLIKILTLLVLVLLGFVFAGGLLVPKEIKVSVTQNFGVSVEELWPSLTSFEEKKQWDTWLLSEPNAKYQIFGEEGRISSQGCWEGDRIGVGCEKIVDIEIYKRVTSSITFQQPISINATSSFTLNRLGSYSSKVTWDFYSVTPYPLNIVHLLFGEEELKKSFVQSLNNLERTFEKA